MKTNLLKTIAGVILICSVATSGSAAVYKFRLTTLLGKKLPNAAIFTVNTNSTTWILNLNNGTSISYNILSGSKYDPLCGLNARDNLGDNCEICIRPEPNDAVTIVFTYGKHKYIYKGDVVR